MVKPFLGEGEAGGGKTEIAKVLAEILKTKLIRLQCYEGLDVSTSLYEWNYPKQILWMKQAEICGTSQKALVKEIFSPEFLIQRPLLEAIQSDSPEAPVLLIDEIDRSDEEFEAFLLEVLSDFQITVPEIGTLKAIRKPWVIITSNRTREIHDALKRRCLYHWIDYPSYEKEYRIVLTRLPGIEQSLAGQVARFMQKIRQVDFLKRPGVSETLDWAGALIAMERRFLSEEVVRETIGCILKYQDDIKRFLDSPEQLRGMLESVE
jgi:MoxR-like ATPase